MPQQQPEPQTATWVFTAPVEADLNAIVHFLAAKGCQFNPYQDQIALGQDVGAYAKSSDHREIKQAFQEACEIENIPWPENAPDWDRMTVAKCQAVLNWLAESPTWALEGNLRDYSEIMTTAQADGQLQRLLFN